MSSFNHPLGNLPRIAYMYYINFFHISFVLLARFSLRNKKGELEGSMGSPALSIYNDSFASDKRLIVPLGNATAHSLFDKLQYYLFIAQITRKNCEKCCIFLFIFYHSTFQLLKIIIVVIVIRLHCLVSRVSKL